uniref:Vitellogenin domain-containing protein n=1 Tax=Panagrolaimus superbus TaxID=310955 RepID=A0A914XQ29_9BILA
MFAKGILVLLCASLLALALAGSRDEPRHSYRAGHEYSYDYNGQIASSMSNGEQYSASRFRALVKLYFVSDKTVTVQLEHPQMGQWNEHLETPQELHKFDKFERVQITAEHLEKLNLPFQIRFTNGKISDIKFASGDLTFSENIKRAIINTLQVQLENPSESSEVATVKEEIDGYGFRLNETTIEGDCESLYNVRKVNLESSESNNVDTYNVTKSVDFSQCQYRPEFRYNYFRYAEPKEIIRANIDEKTAQKLIHSNPALDISSVYDFVLNGDRRQFIVKESKVLSRYTYEMLDGQRVRMDTYAIAQSTLKNVERKEASSDSMPSTKSAETLVYSDEFDVLRERFIAEGDDTYLKQSPYMKMTNAVSVVSTIMKRLLESSTKISVEGIDEQSTRYFTQLVSTLRLCTKNDIENIHQKLFENDEHDGIQKTFMQGILSDAMAVAGTKHTIDHLFKKIQNGEISSVKAAYTLSQLMNLRLVSTETINNLENLCQESRVKESEMLKRTCMLTYGALVNAMCKVGSPFKHSDKYTTTVMKRYCSSSTKAEISTNIINFYNSASSRRDKILALKTMGNMGLENTVTFLETIIQDWNIEKVLRIQAIDSLRQMRKEIPRKIQRILLPIFQNRREHPEIRMNALYQLVHSRPEKAVLDMIMTEMIREPNAHVKSFLNQLVYQMTKYSHELYDRETAMTLRSMLKHFRLYSEEEKTPLFTSKFYSTVVAVEHNQIHELATQLNFAALFSNDSSFPKEIMTTMNLLANNRMIPNTYQLGMHTQNAEHFIERLYNSMNEKDLDQLLVRGRRSIAEESVNFLKGLYNRMKIATRRFSSEEIAPMVLLYSRFQDMDTFFCLTDEESLPELVKTFIVDGQVDVSRWELDNFKFSWASASYQHEQKIKMPTIAGLPLLTTIRIPTLTVVDGSITTNFNDKQQEESSVRSARIHLKVEPKIATTVIIKMEVFSPLFTSGIKTLHSAQLRLPLNLVGKVHAPHWTPEIEIIMPTEEVRVLHLQTRPVTFFRTWPAKSGVFVEATEKTLIVESATTPLKEKRYNYVDPFLGLNVNVDAHWHASPLMASEKLFGDWLLSGENAFELKIQPTADSSKALKLSFKATGKKSKEIPDVKIPNFSNFYGAQTNEMLSDAHRDEEKLIHEQLKVASGKLHNFHHFVIKAETIKGARPHVAKYDLTTLCDNRMILCIARQNIDIDSEWTSKSTVELGMPELRGVVDGFPSQHFIAKIDTVFGSTEKSQITLNIYGRPSAQKIEMVKRFVNIRDEKNVEYDIEGTFNRAPEVLKPNDYKLIVENKLSPKLNHHLRSIYAFLAATQFVNMPQPELVEQEIKKSSQIIMSRFILDQNNCNMTISMPDNRKYQMNWDNNDDATDSNQAYGLFDKKLNAQLKMVNLLKLLMEKL